MNVLGYVHPSDSRRLVPSQIVHAVTYRAGMGYQLVCDTRWHDAYVTYHARKTIEVDLVGRATTVALTSDLVDCMSCLIVLGSGS